MEAICEKRLHYTSEVSSPFLLCARMPDMSESYVSRQMPYYLL